MRSARRKGTRAPTAAPSSASFARSAVSCSARSARNSEPIPAINEASERALVSLRIPFTDHSRMQKNLRRYFVALIICLPLAVGAQEKQRFANMDEANQAGAILAGRQGPRNVNWIEGGKRFSFIDRDPGTNTPVIRAYDPATGRDTLLFRNTGLTFPGTNQPFSYDSFEWAQDSRHLVFQSNF